MSHMDRLEETFKALREADRPQQAPEYLETRLRAAFRDHHAPKPGWLARRWWWVGALAASLLVALSVWRASSPQTVHAPTPSRPPAIAEAPPRPAAPSQNAGAVRAPAPAPHAKSRRARAPVVARSAPQEPVEIEFIPVPYAPPMLPGDQGEVIRVRLPRQALRTLGFPVNEERFSERVPADILLGPDGIARGVRLVRSSEIQ